MTVTWVQLKLLPSLPLYPRHEENDKAGNFNSTLDVHVYDSLAYTMYMYHMRILPIPSDQSMFNREPGSEGVSAKLDSMLSPFDNLVFTWALVAVNVEKGDD